MTLDEAIERNKGIQGNLEYKKLIHYKEDIKAIQLGIEALEREKISRQVAEFAYKVAIAMNELRSSHVFFVLQQAFGDETEWGDAQEILNNIIGWSTIAKEPLPSETEEEK